MQKAGPALVTLGLLVSSGVAQSLQVDSPGRHRLDKTKLDAARTVLAEKNTKNFLVVRDGWIVYEWYAPDSGPDKPHYTASLAKALVGGMSLLVALNDGRLRVDDPAWKYVPAWEHDPQKSKITIRHLATHSSGIEDAEQDNIPHMDLPGWKGAFWKRTPDPFTPAIHDAPVIFPPGTAYAYSNPGMGALSYAITASLRGARQTDVRALLMERILRPVGVTDSAWSIGYSTSYEVDGLRLVANWGGGAFTARATACVGLLMLQRGNWSGRQLVAPGWVDRVTAYASTPLPKRNEGNPQPGSGLCWWTNFDRVWPKLPPDSFAGAGAGQQVLLVIPSLGMVVVRNGGAMTGPEQFWGAIEKYVFDPVIDAVEGYSPGAGLVEAGPYPPSPVIREIRFGEKSSIIRKSRDSDNWPLTWASDDNLYTAYGDGYGFEPRLANKLSLGFAKILGTPDDFQAINIRSPSGEQTGDGAAGKKASSLLFVGGRLYMWARNAANSQLAYSDDFGKSWTWSDWKFETSFGHPVFLNYGKDYAGARDDYVYLYSQDAGSAYQAADRMVLARVPRAAVLNREAYEFFAKMNGQTPEWSRDITRRGPVFSHPGSCYRSSISYSAALKRYLWVQILPGAAPRFFGGLAIYDGPEPWGPWTTAYFNRYFDVGPGENAHLPTKWMSANGQEMYLVFSGDDCFSVRRLEIVTDGGGGQGKDARTGR
jgi:CubicO group peptidase (beta-lactamase class C family)